MGLVSVAGGRERITYFLNGLVEEFVLVMHNRTWDVERAERGVVGYGYTAKEAAVAASSSSSSSSLSLSLSAAIEASSSSSLSLSPKHGLLKEVVGAIEAGGDGLIVGGGRRNQDEGQEVVDGVEEGVGINGVELDLASMKFSLRLHLREWVPIIHMISAVENEARISISLGERMIWELLAVDVFFGMNLVGVAHGNLNLRGEIWEVLGSSGLTSALCSQFALDLRRPNDAVTPQINPSIFNEGSGSRR
ncbi:hypothetical protein RHMOL_Rhmol07G0131700 [Rhododendron molle]|uniref:Uncharacterized protein n=1 Tax=Rhododendron molle TaxID=49168 RepID=A0ACC0N1G6_RHOML|nr:hypothetical protein RHMOL_Rhmol07G0131700 [Rhododendron molle]